MTGDVRMRYTARTLQEAYETAEERWKIIMDDPSATLPWSTHFDIWEEEKADDGSDMEVAVRITFDRTNIKDLEAES